MHDLEPPPVEPAAPTEQRSAITVMLAVQGAMDEYNKSGQLAAARQLLETPDVAEIIVNLGGVHFLDSSGLSTMVMIRSLASARGVRFRVTGLSTPIRTRLARVGLATLFAIDD